MSKLTILAHVTAEPHAIEFVEAELQELIAITRAEEGCLQYDLHRDNDNPAHFVFYENWASRELWQKHMSAPHLAAYMKATESSVAAFTVHELTYLD